MTDKTNVLIIGASRGIGLAVTRTLLERGHRVRAFARGATAMPLEHERLEKADGDALSADDVRASLEGIDAVVCALGVPFDLRLFTGPISLFSESTRVLLPVMQEAGVARLVAVTGFGAGNCLGAIHPLQRIGFNLVFGRAYADKSVQEQLIKASELDWTLVRPGVLTNGRARSDYRVLVRPDEWRNGIVSRASVADFVANALENRSFIGEAPVLVN